MIADTLDLSQFERTTATEDEWQQLTAFSNALKAEQLPDDPPDTVDEIKRQLNSAPSFVEFKIWLVRERASSTNENEIVAQANVGIAHMQSNQHIAEFSIAVLPAYRQRGIARQLLSLVTDFAISTGRRLLFTDTYAHIPAGAAFMAKLGASLGVESHENQLKLDKLDRNLLGLWQTTSAERASGFELGLWEGPYPEAALPAMTSLIAAITRDEPHGDLEVEAFQLTPEQLREMDENMVRNGMTRWTVYAREKASGTIAGYSELILNPNRPYLARQGGTGVLAQYRNRGLGRWMKAVMLEKLLRARPEVAFVRTGNADSNAPMLKINRELGFKPYISQSRWQIDIARAKEYLDRSAAVVAEP